MFKQLLRIHLKPVVSLGWKPDINQLPGRIGPRSHLQNGTAVAANIAPYSTQKARRGQLTRPKKRWMF